MPTPGCEHGQIPGDGTWGAEGECICPEETPNMIDGKCGKCMTPKSRFQTIGPETETNQIGSCHCPEKEYWVESKKVCVACPEIGEWVFDETLGECKKKCGDETTWQQGKTGPESGMCVCAEPNPHWISGKCESCPAPKDYFTEIACVPQPEGLHQPCGTCECDPTTKHFNAIETKCIACDDPKKTLFDESTGVCYGECPDDAEWDYDLGKCKCTQNVVGEIIVFNEEKQSCKVACPDDRPIATEEGKCRAMTGLDCDSGFFDPLNMICTTGGVSKPTYDNWARHLCIEYLNGKRTFKEASTIAQEIVTMNFKVNKLGIPQDAAVNCANAGCPYKSKTYKYLLDNWRSALGDSYAQNYKLPEVCNGCMGGVTPFDEEANVKCDNRCSCKPGDFQNKEDVKKCPIYEDLATEPNSMYVTYVNRMEWDNSCKFRMNHGVTKKNPTEKNWKCKIKNDDDRKHMWTTFKGGIPVPLPRFSTGKEHVGGGKIKVVDYDGDGDKDFFICPTPWQATEKCEFTNGKKNSDPCTCGTSVCSQASGLMCTASKNICCKKALNKNGKCPDQVKIEAERAAFIKKKFGG